MQIYEKRLFRHAVVEGVVLRQVVPSRLVQRTQSKEVVHNARVLYLTHHNLWIEHHNLLESAEQEAGQFS